MSEQVQPPEGLRKIMMQAVIDFSETWNGEFGDYPQDMAEAMLTALFEACEVREEWGVRWTWPDGMKTGGYGCRSREEAEAELRRPTAAASAGLIRRCVLWTPTETITPPVPSTREEKS